MADFTGGPGNGRGTRVRLQTAGVGEAGVVVPDLSQDPGGELDAEPGLFIAMTLDSWRNQGRVVLAEVADILAQQLTAAARAQLALPAWPDDADGFESAYLAVRRTFHAAEAVMDPSPLPKRRLPRAEALRLEREADPEQLAARRQLLVEVTNRIVEASLAPARAVIEEFWDGSAAVDATPIRTFSRGVSATGPDTATDPDAAWYVREGNHRDPATTPQAGRDSHHGNRTKKKAKRYLFGFEATLVVTGDTSSTPPSGTPAAARDHTRHLPALVLAFTVHKPGHDPAGNAITALRDMRRRNYPTGWLAADRAYNAALPENFHIPVRDLGYRPVWDYRIDQLGIQGTHAGALLIDGTWYCPNLPEALTTATADLLNKKIDKNTWRARIDARASYRLRPKPPTTAAPKGCSAPRQAPTPPSPARSNAAVSAGTPACPSSTSPPPRQDTQRSTAASHSPSPATSASATGRNSTTASPPGSTTTSASATASSTSTATPRTTKPSNAPAPAASAESPPSPSSSPSRSPTPTTANSPAGSTPSRPTANPPAAAPPTATNSKTPITGPSTATSPTPPREPDPPHPSHPT